MTARPVTKTGKDRNGDIISLQDASWGTISKAGAISDIEVGPHTYYVPWTTGHTPIRIANGATGKYLHTDRDATTRNNLLDLPDAS